MIIGGETGLLLERFPAGRLEPGCKNVSNRVDASNLQNIVAGES